MRYLHTMIRVRDLPRAIHFFCEGLGLTEVRRRDHEQGRFTLVFLGERGEGDSPQLELVVEFTRKDGRLDTATTTFVPSLRSLHMFQDNMPVTAAYDPDDPHEITIVELGGTPDVAPAAAPITVPSTSTTALADSLRHVGDSLRQALEAMKASMKNARHGAK